MTMEQIMNYSCASSKLTKKQKTTSVHDAILITYSLIFKEKSGIALKSWPALTANQRNCGMNLKKLLRMNMKKRLPKIKKKKNWMSKQMMEIAKRSQSSERQRYQGGSLEKNSESGQKRQEQYQKHENNHGKTKTFPPKSSELRRRYQP